MPVSGKLDEISEAIGRLRTAVDMISTSMMENRRVQDKRHSDNQEAFAEIRQSTQQAVSELRQVAADRYSDTTRALEKLSFELREHAEAVATIRPQLTALQVGRARLVLLASVGLLAIFVIGRALETGLQAGVTWIFQHMK